MQTVSTEILYIKYLRSGYPSVRSMQTKSSYFEEILHYFHIYIKTLPNEKFSKSISTDNNLLAKSSGWFRRKVFFYKRQNIFKNRIIGIIREMCRCCSCDSHEVTSSAEIRYSFGVKLIIAIVKGRELLNISIILNDPIVNIFNFLGCVCSFYVIQDKSTLWMIWFFNAYLNWWNEKFWLLLQYSKRARKMCFHVVWLYHFFFSSRHCLR